MSQATNHIWAGKRYVWTGKGCPTHNLRICDECSAKECGKPAPSPAPQPRPTPEACPANALPEHPCVSFRAEVGDAPVATCPDCGHAEHPTSVCSHQTNGMFCFCGAKSAEKVSNTLKGDAPVAQPTVLYEVYECEDGVLADLPVPKPCPIRIELKHDVLRLAIGPRDFQWNRKTGELTDSGAFIGGDQ